MALMASSRAALLPHPADPFLFSYWLKMFERVWQDEVDKLYIYISSPIEADVRNYMIDLCNANPKISLQWNDQITDHGIALDRMLDIVTEDYIFIVEDDGFIFKPGFVNKYFETIETGQADVVASARGSCATEILEAAKAKWGLSYEGIGDRGPNFWPCFFWCRKELLMRTDRNFRAKHWKQGDIVPGIELVVANPNGIVGDTFVNTSMQIRAMIPDHRIHMVPQYHGSPLDLDDYAANRNLWNGYAPWTHVGSLSSGTHGVLRDDYGRPLARRSIDPPNSNDVLPSYCNSEGERMEWERRIQWFLMFLEDWLKDHQGSLATPITDFAAEYRKAIERVIRQYGLSKERIRERIRVYNELGL